MRTVFLDLVDLLSLWDERDQWHSRAVGVYRELLAQKAGMVTTESVLLKCGNAASRLKRRPIVVFLRKRLVEDGRLLETRPEDVESAWLAYEKVKVREPGIVDQISFHVMRRFHLTEIFTTDQHFKTAGFITPSKIFAH